MDDTRRLSPETDRIAVSVIRGLAMDAPLAAKSGHQGTAMALAPLGHVLYSRILRHDPSRPRHPYRDRFILSNGHASILQYALLYLSGYGIELDDLRAFRSLGSRTPGHPEFGHTPGVETTTGPLGQGFANAVGMAIAERLVRERIGNHASHHIYCLVGDGCLMEGVSHEAASLAGHLGLDRLVCVFDDNRITIDGSTTLSCSDDVPARFRSYGWNVVEAGEIADDCDALEAMLVDARDHRGSPTLCVLRTHIGHPSPDLTDRHEAHGNPFTAELVERTKVVMGVPNQPFWCPDDLLAEYRRHCARRGATLATVASASLADGPSVDDLRAALPSFADGASIATRVALATCLESLAPLLPDLVAGSADLTGNTGVKIPGFEAQSATSPAGRQLFFGIREHAMGAAAVGMALHGALLPVVGTFFVFVDYLRPSLRLAALTGARVVFVFSHDSVGVGEDGPTHQPVEQLAALRATPGLRVIRPADARETAEALLIALTNDGPTALVLSRQNLPVVTDGTAVSRGAGVVRDAPNGSVTVVATGSEVSVALAAADRLADEGVAIRVVSMPSWDLFARQPVDYRESVLPTGRAGTVAIEAGSSFGWDRYAEHVVGIDRFGVSAPGSVALTHLGIGVDALIDVVRRAADALRP